MGAFKSRRQDMPQLMPNSKHHSSQRVIKDKYFREQFLHASVDGKAHHARRGSNFPKLSFIQYAYLDVVRKHLGEDSLEGFFNLLLNFLCLAHKPVSFPRYKKMVWLEVVFCLGRKKE